MFYKLAVIGLGDMRRSDKGLACHLVNKLKLIFAKRKDILFIQDAQDGSDLYQLLTEIKSKNIIVIDTIYEIIKPACLNYLELKTDGERIKRLMLITIGITKDDWGKKFSQIINDKFDELLAEIITVIDNFIE